jgi:hypothetical protein
MPLFAHVGSVGTAPFLATVGDIALFHAPFIAADMKYAAACEQTASQRFTILDCAALEIAIGTETADTRLGDILEMSSQYRISEVVCPDTPMDPRGSLRRSLDFIGLWERLPPTAKRPRLMVVPHADTVTGWFRAAEDLIRKVPECTVGIARVFAKRCGRGDPMFRVRLAGQIRSAYPLIQVHLLGAGEDYLSEIPHIVRSPSVRSVDSTFIHRYTVAGTHPTAEYARPVPLRDFVCPSNIEERTQQLKAVLTQAGNGYGRTMQTL